ncbi:MAG TPA: DUF4350 domain-containing protein, partial [Candidatus Manganitrophaceae bacterium]|nr:DUF4350 domain-containing protein [Candidatus Manganitrophaceae bacterium]
AHLLVLRFDAGDVYPVYSSLRSDPLRTKIFYESLDALDGISVSRNYRPFSKLSDRTKTTLFYFGASRGLLFLSEEEARALEALAAAGNRLVILFHPRAEGRFPLEDSRKETGKGSEEKDQDRSRQDVESKEEGKAGEARQPEDKEETIRGRQVLLEERWNFKAVRKGGPDQAAFDRKPSALRSAEGAGLPMVLSWHSPVDFDHLGGEWKTIYAREGRPVVIERAFGFGTIVLSSDTFFVSNEAMRMERHSGLLAWLVGPNRSVIFDERHLGIEENPGIAALGRKYGLEGLSAALLLLVVLFIWKNSFSLVPPYPDDPKERNRSIGKDALSGFAGLLSRTLPPADLLSVCFEEWRKTAGSRRDDEEERRQIELMIEGERNKPDRERDSVEAYNRVSRVLSERKHLP